MSDIFTKANAGDSDALYELLNILYNEKSSELFKWVQKAISTEPENANFQNYMGICYEAEGYGTEVNLNTAIMWYKKAAEAGNGSSAYNIARIFIREKNSEALVWAKKAYELGMNDAADYIAYIYDNGLGVEVDKNEAFKWCLKGAEAGDIYAQNRLANKYLKGEGCKRNLGEALDWLRTAAEAGNAFSASELSKMYRSGQYFSVDIEEATYYAVMAAKGERPQLSELFSIADMYREGNGVKKSVEKALELYTIVADNGNVDCMNNVGLLYSHEDSEIPRNIEKAIVYFENAGKLGSEKAFYNLKKLYKEKYPENTEEYYFRQILTWANDNNPGVLTELGILYCDGIGVERNMDTGIEYIKRAANYGNLKALQIISDYYAKTANPDAEKYLKMSIKAGNIQSKTVLGKLYVSGEEYTVKKSEGIELLKDAAEKNNDPEAMYYLGKFENKEDWWKKAAEFGHKDATYELALMYYLSDKYDEAEKLAKKGSEPNIVGCINLYADMLKDDIIKTEERSRIYTYYERTASVGNIYGEDMAGMCYLYGQGGAAKDIAKAIQYFTNVVEQSNPERNIASTKINLGYAYSIEESTQNLDLAAKYLKEGINEYEDKTDPLYEDAIIDLAKTYISNKRERFAVELLEKSVNEGYVRCSYWLAICYIDGLGTGKDHRKAKYVLQDAINSQKLSDEEKKYFQEMWDDLLNGKYGTDGSINGSVNGGSVYQSGNSVSYRPDNNSNKRSGGCYIATCVYGSYDCPNVWVLRRFRDYKLSHYVLGRVFIRVYYAVSPELVRCFGNQTWFRKMWSGVLNPFVRILRKKGYSDKEYED